MLNIFISIFVHSCFPPLYAVCLAAVTISLIVGGSVKDCKNTYEILSNELNLFEQSLGPVIQPGCGSGPDPHWEWR